MAQQFDLSDLRELSDGDEAFVHDMVTIFIRETSQALAGLKAAAVTGDMPQIRMLSHKIKPSLMNLHIDIIREEILQLERQGETEFTPEKAAMLQKVCTVLENVLVEMADLPKP